MRSSRLLAALVLTCAVARAQTTPPTTSIPVGLSHAGRLFDTNDSPVNQSLEVTFTLYKQAAGGSGVWSQKQQVAFEAGYYSVMLGAADSQSPLTAQLFDGPVFLGITIGNAPELSPRQRISSVPYALRAALAERMDGGTIQNATISGSSIDATEVKVGGKSVIDAAGHFVGPTDQLSAAKLGDQPAAAFDTRAQAESKFVLKAGDQMTGALTTTGALSATGAVTGGQLVSTTTTDAPLQVASSQLVTNLNAEMVGGKKLADIVTQKDFAAHDFTNLAQNPSFELGASAGVPTFWRAYGATANATRQVVQGGVFGARAASVTDLNTANDGIVGLEQVLVRQGQAAGYAGRTFTASVWAKKTAGVSTGRLCIADTGADGAETKIDCADIAPTADFAQTTVTHVVSAAPEYLSVILLPTKNPAEAGTYAFDGVMVTAGAQAVPFAAPPGEQVAAPPIGTILAYTTHLDGTPDVLPYGWAKCDGTSAADQGIPDAVITAALPNLNQSGRFLRGGAASGVLQDDQLQTHTHANDIATNGGGAVTTGGQSNDHTHSGTTGGASANHVHGGSTGYVSANHSHAQYVTANSGCGNIRRDFQSDGNSCPYDQGVQTGGISANHYHDFTTGGVSADHTHGITTGGASANHTHSVPAHDHPMKGGVLAPNTGRIGSETRPANMSVLWIIRVK